MIFHAHSAALRPLGTALLVGSALAGPARAADAPAVAPSAEIVVTAERLRIPGQVDSPQPPLVTLDEQDIAAYGATSLADLIQAISPQTGSGRGRGGGFPIILVNGLRISSFREMRDFPPEAIRRVEILPEDVALRYGYPPDQRVVNLILKDHFRSRQAEVEDTAPGAGGTDTLQTQAGLLSIEGARRFNVTLKADRTRALSDAARGVVEQPGSLPGVASDPQPGDNRTLVAARQDYSANAVLTRGLGEKGAGGALTFNATASRAISDGLSGLNSLVLTAPASLGGAALLRTLPGPLTSHALTDTVQGGLTLTRQMPDWQLTLTLDGGHVASSTASLQRAAPADLAGLQAAALAGTLPVDGALPAIAPGAVRVARSISDSATSLATMVGHPLRLPAGKLALTLRAGFAWTGLASSDSLAPGPGSSLRRGDLSGGINLGVPLTSRREHVGAALGDITLNASLGADRLSDFGWLIDWSGGLTWNVTPKLGLQASYIVNQAAPGLAQLGNPQISQFNVPLYDFASGRTVLVTTLSGGNPALARQQQRDLKLGANWNLPLPGNANLIAEYFHNASSNVTNAFPLLTPAIEAAFPGRVTRLGGVIVALDQRAVTLAHQSEERLRWGLNLGGNLGQPLPPGAGRRGMFGMGGGGMGGGGMGGGPRGPRYPGRWNLSFYHTVQLVDRVLAAPGGPVLDLLGGDALAGGGVARHSLEGEGGFYYKGLGLRLNGTWGTPTTVRASGLPGSSDLRFGSVAKLNLRGFFDLGQLPAAEHTPFLKGARLAFGIGNLFNQRQRVTDGNGLVPLAYQPALIDPLGRTFNLELRKLF